MKMCNIRMSQVGDKDGEGAMLDLGPYKGVKTFPSQELYD